MDTWLIVVIALAAVLAVGVVVWALERGRARKLEERRAEAGEHREEAELRAIRARERREAAEAELERADREHAVAQAHARRADELDPDVDEDGREDASR
jgi:hypothetical protein